MTAVVDSYVEVGFAQRWLINHVGPLYLSHSGFAAEALWLAKATVTDDLVARGRVLHGQAGKLSDLRARLSLESAAAHNTLSGPSKARWTCTMERVPEDLLDFMRQVRRTFYPSRKGVQVYRLVMGCTDVLWARSGYRLTQKIQDLEAEARRPLLVAIGALEVLDGNEVTR